MPWRQVMPRERFIYNYSPKFHLQAGIRRGYAAQSKIFLHGHEHCSCHRSKHPDSVTWFLQHSDSEHGLYPVPYTNESLLLDQLREQLPSLRPGFVVYVSDTLSYGQIRDA